MVNYSWKNIPLILVVQGSSKNVGESTSDDTPAQGFGKSILPSHLFCSVNQGSRALMHTSQCWHYIPLVLHSFQYCSKDNSFQTYIPPCIHQLGS